MALSTSPRIKPPALRPGDTIGIVAPASNIKRGDLNAGCEALRSAGYRPFYFDSILEQDRYFAGANYLLQALDLEKIKAHPKIFLGYSDVTALLTYFADIAELVTFHGPMVAKDWTHEGGIEMNSWHAALSGAAAWELKLKEVPAVSGLVEGSGEGVLYGGCLSILVASLGTPYEIHTSGTILFLEDFAAKPYQIDRMLIQLKLAGKFEGVRGIVFGEMLNCIQTANQGYKLEEVVMRIVGELGVPVAYGVPSGHVTKKNITLPIGVRAELTVLRGLVKLTILESSVQS
jgi:muramoyltetrapeptide carboxypeptidase